MAENNKLQGLFHNIFVSLGGSSIEVELEDDDFNTAFENSVRAYRERSYNSVNSGFWFMELQMGKLSYDLPRDIDNVKAIYRSRTGIIFGESFEPFSAAFLQQILVGNNNQVGFGGFATYDFMMQYQEMVGRIFGERIQFFFHRNDSSVHIMQNPRSPEKVALEVSRLKSIDQLLDDGLAYTWLKDYTLALCKSILGEKYSKMATLPGAQGGVQLKGEALKTESKEMVEKLHQDIQDYAEGNEMPGVLIG